MQLVLLAHQDGEIVGCAALRALDKRSAEMKRMYVRPAGRGRKLGRHLAQQVCAQAKALGYQYRSKMQWNAKPG